MQCGDTMQRSLLSAQRMIVLRLTLSRDGLDDQFQMASDTIAHLLPRQTQE